ncbi:MAG: hypothetical protein K9H14_06035 [Actinomycetia bacterium]|nr:hypothetical protein [Actinomycetes bacterium]
MDEKIKKAIKNKIKEADKLKSFDSRHPRFKTWHAATMSLLKTLPPEPGNKIGQFKKLSFEDTKYHRGRNLYDPAQNQKYLDDLSAAAAILKELIPKKEKKDSQ